MEDYLERALHRERRPVLRPPTPIVEFESTEFGALDASQGQLIERISTVLGLPTPRLPSNSGESGAKPERPPHPRPQLRAEAPNSGP